MTHRRFESGSRVEAKRLTTSPLVAGKPSFTSTGSAKLKGPRAGVVGVERQDVGTQSGSCQAHGGSGAGGRVASLSW